VSSREPRIDDELSLELHVTEPDGTPSALEPYMGMLSHAAVTAADGSVFVHLHPAGSISMAAMQQFQAGEGGPVPPPGMAMPGMAGMAVMAGGAPNVVRFPFAFPAAGAYRVFVQVKVAGVVETAAFDVEVE
jgi:hypothetical protein